MHRSPRLLLAFLLGCGVATVQPGSRLMASAAPQDSGTRQKPTLKPAAATAADIPFDNSEYQVELELLALANQSRRQAGAPQLTLDGGLSEAARIHAQAMLDAKQLSHQFVGEPTLPQRLANASQLQLELAGENVALDYDAAHGHEHLMHSPPHRANLLNPAYNVVGMGVVASGDRLYIVEDFGRALPHYSSAELKGRIIETVNQTRLHGGLAALSRRDLRDADDAACSMASADKLGTAPVRRLAGRSTVLTYTSLHPETLPGGAIRALGGRNLHSYSLGACYARTPTYPSGVYWVVLSVE